MRDNFDASFALVIKSEGGRVDDPQDPGGRTNFGITQATFNAWLSQHGSSHRDVFNITPDEVKAIYRAEYWAAVRGDDLPAGLDYAAFDFAVNSGVARAAIYLQDIVGAAPDGKIGPVTLKAIAAESPLHLITKLSALRLNFLKRLSTWKRFGRGWEARVNAVEASAIRMAQGG
jgi:lysozyme family protein